MTITSSSQFVYVDATGVHGASFDDIYLWYVAQYQSIYGSDVVLTPDTQDGQWIAIQAQAAADVVAAAIAVYNSFSPSTAQGTGLASVVKINGLAKEASTNSTCPVTITGDTGTIITNGTVKDDAGFVWSLPATVEIPVSASIIVTATCQTTGAITAAIGAITKINTPTRGWLSVTNASAAAVGAAGESDAKLRQRQSVSTAIAAQSPMDSIAAAVRNVLGVTRVNWDENTSSTTNANSTPGHSFAMVVEGGDATTIAQTIASKKTPGTGTAGTISETIIDAFGIPSVIAFSAPTYKRIIVNVSIKPFAGYTVQIGNNLVAAIAAYITGLEIGAEVDLNNVINAAIDGSGGKGAFKIPPGGLTQAIFGNTAAAADIAIAFNQAATCAVADVTLSLVT